MTTDDLLILASRPDSSHPAQYPAQAYCTYCGKPIWLTHTVWSTLDGEKCHGRRFHHRHWPRRTA